MRDAIIIAVVCVLAIAAGAWLFLMGDDGSPVTEGDVAFTVLAEGNYSGSITERKNFRIRSEAELQELWRMVYTTGGPAAAPVNFEKSEVLAVFDGTHASGGYGIEVESIEDSRAVRTIHIVHTAPDDSCLTTESISSPFQMIVVPASSVGLTRDEREEVVSCQ